MSRGNQRDIDRQRAANRKQKEKGRDTDGLTPLQRKERDAERLQQKIAAKQTTQK